MTVFMTQGFTSDADVANIGIFFTNDAGDLQCAGSSEVPPSGQPFQITLWGSEAGLDNGMAEGEEFTWLAVDANGNSLDVSAEYINGSSGVYSLNSISFVGSLNIDSPAPSCDADLVTVNMFDSYGDGGGQVTVGSLILLGEGSSVSATVCLDLSECSPVDYAATDSWSDENSWSITDADGNLLAEGGNQSGLLGDCGVAGCVFDTACNFNPSATTDDGSCVFAPEGLDCEGNCFSGIAVSAGGGSYDSEVSWTIIACDG